MFSPVRIFRASAQTTKCLGVLGGVHSLYFHTEGSSKMSKFHLADKYKGLEKNVWVEFIQLALEHKPLNLGQGFPDDLVPDYVLNTLAEVVKEPSIFMNQYTRGFVSRRFVVGNIFISYSTSGSSKACQRLVTALHQTAGQTRGSGPKQGNSRHGRRLRGSLLRHPRPRQSWRRGHHHRAVL